MSSIINRPAAPAEVPSNGQAASRIVHFDATARRKEKMRQRASKESPAAGHERGNGSLSPTAAASAVQTSAPEVAAPSRTQPPTLEAPAPPQPESPRPATAPQAPPAGAESVPAASLPSGPELEKFLVDFVVEQTGYPEEMVELDADLEADLGIDSIKKAQLFGEMAEHFDIQVQGVEEMSLDDFPTLRHVMDFLQNASSGGNAAVSASPAGPAAEAVSAPTAAPMPAPRPTPPSAGSPTAAAAPSAAVSPQAAEVAAAPGPGTPAASSAPTAKTALSGEELERFMIGFVVEQTGYPEEMVELDADLEADLGIDSIKKAQLFGEMAEHFDVGVVQLDVNLSLDDFPTLRHVMDFLENGSAGGRAAAASTPPAVNSHNPPPPVAEAAPQAVAPAATPAAAAVAPQSQPVSPVQTQAASPLTMSGVELEEFLVNFVVEQTGYPPEMVELDADLEADLGIDSIKKAQLFGEMAEQFDITIQPTDEELSLDDFPTLRHVMDFLQNVPAT